MEKAQNGEDFDTLISDYSPNTANDSDENGYIFTDNETGIELKKALIDKSRRIYTCSVRFGILCNKTIAA